MKPPSNIGRYRILGLLGQGAMGVVYRGRDDALERDVAIKVMSATVLADQEARDRFVKEARAAARLQHPNIVTIYELGQHEGLPFMALELLEGMDLQRAIEAGIRPDPKLTLPIILQLLAGLGHAHEHGIIHRDVKPSNVFLPHGRPVKIMDFGVARVGGAGMATQGMVVGTPTYMSPEQVKGGHLDGRSDLFSAGLILYELVTGEKCLRGTTVVELLYKVVHEDRDLSSLPAEPGWEALREVLRRALRREPDERYPDARAMMRDLQKALLALGGSGDGAHASDLGLLLRTPRPRPIPPGLTAEAAEAATILGGGTTPAPFGAGGAAQPTLQPAGATAPQPTSELPRTLSPQGLPTRVEAGRARPAWPLLAGAAGVALVVGFLLLRHFGGEGVPTPAPSLPPSAAPSPATGTVAAPSPAPATPKAGPTATPRPATPSPTPTPTGAAPTPAPTAAGPTPLPSARPSPVAEASPAGEPAEPPPVSPQSARVDRAEQLLEQGRYAAALAEARGILAREPQNAEAREIAQEAEASLVVERALKLAREALARGDKDTAEAELRKGMQVRPTDARLLALWREATQ